MNEKEKLLKIRFLFYVRNKALYGNQFASEVKMIQAERQAKEAREKAPIWVTELIGRDV